MFCNSLKNDDPSTLPCPIKLVSEIISLISIIFSSMVIYVTATRTKLNIINKLILQILISEVIDGINILIVVFDDILGERKFEDLIERRYVCFSQIFLAIFSCLWTISSSFLISLRIFDIAVKNSNLFKKKILKKYLSVFSLFIPLFTSFCFWFGQTAYQAQFLEKLPYDVYYTNHIHYHFRHMYCWFEKYVSLAIFIISLILIGATIFFSVKGIQVMKSIKLKLTDELKLGQESFLNKRQTNVEYIIKTLWTYPMASAILWILYFVLQILYDNGVKGFTFNLIYCIIISIRQPIYTFIFLYTQKDIKRQFIKFITCKYKNKNKSIIIRSLKPNEKPERLSEDNIE